MSLVMAVMNSSTKLDIKLGGINLQAVILLSKGYIYISGIHEQRISRYRDGGDFVGRVLITQGEKEFLHQM